MLLVLIFAVFQERANETVSDFFGGMSEDERKNVKELSCKLVKQIKERQMAESKTNCIRREKEMLESELEVVKRQMEQMEKEKKKHNVEMEIIKRQNEYKVFLAQDTEKDKVRVEKELMETKGELQQALKINSISEQLAKVEDKAQWANSIRKTQSMPEQANVFFESYRLALVKEDELKAKN